MSHQIRGVRLGGDRARAGPPRQRGAARADSWPWQVSVNWARGVTASWPPPSSAAARAGPHRRSIGTPHRDETFEAKQITVTPVGENGVRIREVVDEDFGTDDKHGYQRIIPNDFGVPTDIEADVARRARRRVASPTRPTADDADPHRRPGHDGVRPAPLHPRRTRCPTPALDAASWPSTSSAPTRRWRPTHFEVVVTGLELADPPCNVGAHGRRRRRARSPPTATRTGPSSARSSPAQGITIGGTIVGRTDAVDVADAADPRPPRADNNVPLAAGDAPARRWPARRRVRVARRRGRNEVFAGGAADAAFGSTLPPLAAARLATGHADPARRRRPRWPSWPRPSSSRRRASPRGRATCCSSERIDDDTVSAWFSGHVGHGRRSPSTRTTATSSLGTGPKYATAPTDDAAVLGAAVRQRRRPIALDGYDKDFATAWRAVRDRERAIDRRRRAGGSGCRRAAAAASSALSRPAC